MDKEQKMLLKAARANDMKRVDALLADGVDPNCRDHVTPLQAAAMHGNVGMAELLLYMGARVNTRALMGQTALQYAMERITDKTVRLRMVRLLLQYGADAAGRGSFLYHEQIAIRTGDEALISLIREAINKECGKKIIFFEH